MKYLKVNGHVAGKKTGVIFTDGGQHFEVDRATFDAVMNELFDKKQLKVSENLTLTY